MHVRPFPGPGGKWRVSTGGGSVPLWSRTEGVLYSRSGDGIMAAPYAVRDSEFIPGKPRLWAAMKDLDASFDLSPDGKRFVVLENAAGDRSSASVTFLFNFFDELQRRVPAGK